MRTYREKSPFELGSSEWVLFQECNSAVEYVWSAKLTDAKTEKGTEMMSANKLSVVIYISAITLLIFGCRDSTSSLEETLPDEYSLTTSVTPEGSGLVEPSEGNFLQETEVEIEAIAEEGYRFTGWDGDILGDMNPIRVKINSDKEVIAKFEIHQTPAINIEIQPDNTEAGEPVEPAPIVVVTDESANPVPDVTIEVSLNQHAFTDESITTITTDSEGTAVFDQLFIETADSDYYLQFSSDTPDFSDEQSSPFSIVPAEAVRSRDKVDVPDRGRTGNEVVITVILEDRFGNRMTGQRENLSVQISDANQMNAEVSETEENGIYEAVYTPQSIGFDRVSVKYRGMPFEDSPYTIVIFP